MSDTEKYMVKVRSLARSDIGPLMAIWWNDIPEKDMVASQQGGPLDLSLIAEIDGRLVGFVLARLEYQGFPISGVAVIHTIAVEPKHQRKGIGKLLINELQNLCHEEGIQNMRILIPQDDDNLKDHFGHLGFCPSTIINFDKPC